MDEDQRRAIEQWLEMLKSSVSSERMRGAAELADYAVRTRGAIRTRGSASRPARARVPPKVSLSQLVEDFANDSTELRREKLITVGELGDDSMIDFLGSVLDTEQDSSVRAAAVDALMKIGGSRAFALIEKVLDRDRRSDVRIRALRALFELGSTEPGRAQALAAVLRRVARHDDHREIKARARQLAGQLQAH